MSASFFACSSVKARKKQVASLPSLEYFILLDFGYLME